MSPVEQLVLRISSLAREGTENIYREMSVLGIELTGRIKASLAAGEGPTTRSGKLSRAVRSSTTQQPGRVVTEVGVFGGVPYAEIMEKGSRAHAIYPRTKKALRFELSKGETVIVKHVSHPGTPAYHFIGRQVAQAREEIGQRLANALGEKK